MSYREAILNGTKEADALHEALGTKKSVATHLRSNIDIFGAILNQGVKLLFRPLDGLLGACIEERSGVIISTKRPLSVQRFTGAHELGHVVMKHPISIDGEEILRGDMPQTSKEIEIEANAFAAEFLLPRWLLAHHAKQQGWRSSHMENPSFVYQLSLRSGASYDATVRSLEKHKIIDRNRRDDLLDVEPKTIKQELLPGYAPENWFRDVWLLTERDEGVVIEGQPEDLFLFRLNEKAGAGYLWDFETLRQKGFVVLKDQRSAESDRKIIGADVTRLVIAHSPKERKGKLDISLRRPWERMGLPAGELKIQYNLFGKEVGLPRAKRPEILSAA